MMQSRKPSPQPTKPPTLPLAVKKPHASSHHPTPMLDNLSEPSNALDLQRVIGNQATIQLMQERGVIQRMPTDEQLMAVAGRPLNDRLFGLKKMSQKYKDVLNALKTYHERGKVAISSLSILDYQDELLENVRKTCQTYVDGHKDEKERTPHIQKILKEDVTADQAKLDFLRTNFDSIGGKIIGKSVFDAMNLVEGMKSPTDMQSLMQFLQFDTTKALIQDQTKSAGTQPFRGSDDLTLAGKSFTDVVGQDYLDDILSPHIQTIVTEIANSKKSSEPQPSDKPSSPEELLKSPSTVSSMAAIYEHLATGLLVDTEGGALVPQEILDAAAQVYQTVYSTVTNDPSAEHTAQHAARVSVVNMIFLRFINPAVTRIASEMKAKKTEGGAELIRLAQIFQSQVNGIDVLKKFPELSEAGNVVQQVQRAIDTIINGVIAQAQLLGQRKK